MYRTTSSPCKHIFEHIFYKYLLFCGAILFCEIADKVTLAVTKSIDDQILQFVKSLISLNIINSHNGGHC